MQASPADQTLYDDFGSTAKSTHPSGTPARSLPVTATGDVPRGLAGCGLAAMDMERFEHFQSILVATPEQKEFARGFEKVLNGLHSTRGADSASSSPAVASSVNPKNRTSLPLHGGKMNVTHAAGNAIPLCVENISQEFVGQLNAQNSNAPSLQSRGNSTFVRYSLGGNAGPSLMPTDDNLVPDFLLNPSWLHPASCGMSQSGAHKHAYNYQSVQSVSTEMHTKQGVTSLHPPATVSSFPPPSRTFAPPPLNVSTPRPTLSHNVNSNQKSKFMMNFSTSSNPIQKSFQAFGQQQQQFSSAGPQLSFGSFTNTLSSHTEEPQTVPCLDASIPSIPLAFRAPASSPVDMEEQESAKSELKRRRNREAARKCREKKLEMIARLELRIKALKAENDALAQTAVELRGQVNRLKRDAAEHVRRGCRILPTGV